MQEDAAIPGKLALHPGWIAFAALALAVPMSALFLRPAARPELPLLAELPAFSLVDEQGQPFGREEMLGRVWIADFVFTSCADACPKLQAKMRRLQDRLLPPEQGGNLGLLSISVDPERDTPAKLRQYAEIFGARPALWKHLTGPEREVERTVVKGFRIAMAKMPAPLKEGEVRAEAFEIMHGERLVLVDRLGRIRGYYEADDQDRLLHDARSLTVGGRG
jgi:protein SCO1/2